MGRNDAVTSALCLGFWPSCSKSSATWDRIKSRRHRLSAPWRSPLDSTDAELSVSRWELILRVRCRLELLCPAGRSGHCLRKPHFIVALCFLAASTDGMARILEWSDFYSFFVFEVNTGHWGPFYHYSAAYSIILCYDLKPLNKARREVLVLQHTEWPQMCMFSCSK